MLHPVGPLRPVVYWRRRAGVLILLAALGAGGWVGTEIGTGRMPAPWSTVASGAPPAPVAAPALNQVAASVAAGGTGSAASTSAAAVVPAAATTAPPPCTDDMLDLVLHPPAAAPAGSVVTFQLVVTDVGAVPCVRSMGAADQELVLADGGGSRIWSSADCRASAGPDDRTLEPGQPVTAAVTWDGRGSVPGCPQPRAVPAPGPYRAQGRVGTKISAEVSVTVR